MPCYQLFFIFCSVDSLTVNKLAPGGLPRLAIWTKDAVESVDEALAKNEK